MSKAQNIPDSNNKFLFWFHEAKRICEENKDAFVVFDTNEEFVLWILAMMNETSRLSAKTILNYIYENKHVDSMSDEQKYAVKEFREWFAGEKAKQQMNLYKKMNTNNSCWQREDNILAKRFGKKWQKQDNLKLDAEVKVSNLSEKLRKLAKGV